MEIGVYFSPVRKAPKDLEEQIKVLKKQLEIAIEGLMTILNDGDDYWDKCQAQYYLTQIKELDK